MKRFFSTGAKAVAPSVPSRNLKGRQTAPHSKTAGDVDVKKKSVVSSGCDTLSDLTYNTPFKHVFVDHKENLRTLLNSIFEASEDEKIDHIDFIRVPGPAASKIRTAIYDIHCTLNDGTDIIVKLQRLNQSVDVFDVVDGMAGYVSRDYSTQLNRAYGYKLKPVRMVTILGFKMQDTANADADCGSLVQSYFPQPHKGILSSLLQQRFPLLQCYWIVQLPLAPARIDLCTTDMERWAVLLRDAHLYTRDSVPSILKEEPFKAVVDIAYETSLSKPKMRAYYNERSIGRDIESHKMAETKRADGEKSRADREKLRADREELFADEENLRANLLQSELDAMIQKYNGV